MFSLDYRPDLASRVCQNNECDTLIKEGYMSPQSARIRCSTFCVARCVKSWTRSKACASA